MSVLEDIVTGGPLESLMVEDLYVSALQES